MLNTSNDNIVQTTTKFPYRFEDLERIAKHTLAENVFSYIYSGASAENTLQKNNSTFHKYNMIPRLLRDVSKIDMSINLFGKQLPTPLILAPVGVLKMVNEMGDLAVVKAAETFNLPFIQSTVSSFSIEEVSQASSNPKWFQLYWSKNLDVTFNMVNRAEQAGYEAIVLTIDTVTLGWRESDLHHGFSPLANGYGQGIWESDTAFLSSLRDGSQNAMIEGIIDNINFPSLQWQHIVELKKRTHLPIILKGILHPDDALLALQYGVDGIIVSNHGGRQLDGIIPSINALPAIVKAIDGKIPVLFDSGIRRGNDALKAIALGADAVLIGRPFVYSLAIGGEEGVRQFLSNFIQDFQTNMILTGVCSIKEAKEIHIVRE
ncbi:alpha-hydroxy acid oxidase [Sutcliffiella cohnii]|uniref:L-lactate oxidase n=1 Tax=Sutcliffiella cohnii TaxID=33932 RepID=A0A223KJV6_9BACI|nr:MULTISPECIES: alpha-hydroxy acid oxidase [Sutcliffiella]AST89775.1 alpha-hydroxy-acid oxidizing enzyme [Sutcliffiella cohnii]MED4018126.1 alpha-hydroxy acid oxidase [Sutcliffiella cohnii]WBL15400.1 alpha-hydroxy acid oxidase [Sutcliffiella sp. NC1]